MAGRPVAQALAKSSVAADTQGASGAGLAGGGAGSGEGGGDGAQNGHPMQLELRQGDTAKGDDDAGTHHAAHSGDGGEGAGEGGSEGGG